MLQNYLADLQFDGKQITKISTGEVVQVTTDERDFHAHVEGVLRKQEPWMFEPIYNSRGRKIN